MSESNAFISTQHIKNASLYNSVQTMAYEGLQCSAWSTTSTGRSKWAVVINDITGTTTPSPSLDDHRPNKESVA